MKHGMIFGAESILWQGHNVIQVSFLDILEDILAQLTFYHKCTENVYPQFKQPTNF